MQDGYALDEHNIHHRVLSAVVETTPGSDCFGIISIFEDRLELQGSHRLQSAIMKFHKQPRHLQQSRSEYGKENIARALPLGCSGSLRQKVAAA
jgi:hypothetical protein